MEKGRKVLEEREQGCGKPPSPPGVDGFAVIPPQYLHLLQLSQALSLLLLQLLQLLRLLLLLLLRLRSLPPLLLLQELRGARPPASPPLPPKAIAYSFGGNFPTLYAREPH